MPAKETTEMLLSQHLGKEAASKLLDKIDTMMTESTTKIEDAVAEVIATHIEKEVVAAIKVNIGPIEPIKVKPIQVSIKPAIKPPPAIKINTGVSVKVGPQMFVKGTK